MKQKIAKIFIANRGEITRRIALTCKEMQIKTLTVLPADESIPKYYQGIVDEVVFTTESGPYLNADLLVKLAKDNSCDAIHPGYGFLSENLVFAQKIVDAGLIFIGPRPETIQAMASKASASDIAEKSKVPCMPSLRGFRLTEGSSSETIKKLESFAKNNLPLLVKAALGGGGKGMRIVRNASEIKEACERASSEALNAFNDDSLIVERYLEKARHIEVQILGDSHGNVVVLGDRDCSIQRRYQKIIEEAPAPNLSDKTRSKIHQAALSLSKQVKYQSAGTVEFLLDASNPSEKDPDFFFLEMNTRLQVEHPVTEQVFGVDLVEWQIRVANGEPLPKSFESLVPRGHSIELRVYAEDPASDFMPSPGYVACFEPFYARDTRWEIGVDPLSEVNPQYDPMIAKLVVSAQTRDVAIARTRLVLDKTFFCGPKNNLDFMHTLLGESFFKDVSFSTNTLSTYEYSDPVLDEKKVQQLESLLKTQLSTSINTDVAKNFMKASFSAQRSDAQKGPRSDSSLDQQRKSFIDSSQGVKIDVGFLNLDKSSSKSTNLVRYCLYSSSQEIILFIKDKHTSYRLVKPQDSDDVDSGTAMALNEALSPVPGKVVKVLVQEGQKIEAGETVVVLESMKMEFVVKSPKEGLVAKILVEEGQQVTSQQQLLSLEE